VIRRQTHSIGKIRGCDVYEMSERHAQHVAVDAEIIETSPRPNNFVRFIDVKTEALVHNRGDASMNLFSRRRVVTSLRIVASGSAFGSAKSAATASSGRRHLTPDRTINQFLMAGDLGHAEQQRQTLAESNVEFSVSRPNQIVRLSGAEALVVETTRAMPTGSLRTPTYTLSPDSASRKLCPSSAGFAI
jgi:hypothetical protein